ncbi:MAG TPA: DUF1592 domain-containing protein [Bryobacteraceae bacterium]|nr:DUF1592 domain-containing protein [Bryobacteraceae bacterium]
MPPSERNRFHITHRGRVIAAAAACGIAFIAVGGNIRGASTSSNPRPHPAAAAKTPELFAQFCFPCHSGNSPQAGVNIEKLATSQISIGEGFQTWTRIAAALEGHVMPPSIMPQPDEKDRAAAAAWIHSQLDTYAKKHDGDPGKVTVRRLTSGEYAYSILDLTGFNIDTGIDASSDSVGGEGFSNFGDVQFMQDANLEHYLDAAKVVADHAVIGAGPLQFFTDPGKTGFEFSGINRVKAIYEKYGFRTVSGEGGFQFGLEKYGKALYGAWEYTNRAALGEPTVTMKKIADREGIEVRFLQHILEVMNRPGLSYPASDMAAKWHKFPKAVAGGDVKAEEAAARTQANELQTALLNWPGWLFGRGDKAQGGAGDESPLIFNDKALKADTDHHFNFVHRGGFGQRGATPGTGPVKIYLNVASVNPSAPGQGAIIWKNATIAFTPPGAGPGFGRGPGAGFGGGRGASGAGGRGASGGRGAVTGGRGAVAGGRGGAAGASGAAGNTAVAAANGGGRGRGRGPALPRVSLRSVVSAETAKELGFGKSIDGSPIGPDDFSSDGSISFEVPAPPGVTTWDIQLDAVLGSERNHVYRITIADSPQPRGIPTRGLVGDMSSAGYKTFHDGVMEYSRILPPNSNDQPTPADKDPAPEPFDPTYNVPEHDDFVIQVKYIRDDRFVWNYLLNDEKRKELDQAWNDVFASFPYHDNYLRLLAAHYKYDLKGKRMADMTPANIAQLPEEMRKYVTPLRRQWEEMRAAQAAAKPHHVEDVVQFASKAWRRPLTEAEKQGLRAFYTKALAADPDHDHVKAIRAMIARVLVAPQFLYKVELTSQAAAAHPLSNWEMASRLSYFLWSSVPDDELRRAAAAGELTTTAGLRKQVKRMMADEKARRMSTEFFGQWFGFYHFDKYKGVDTGRFPEFTEEVKSAMYDEAVSFFEHIIRTDRPVSDILYADYDYLNKPLAKYYGIKKEVKSDDDVELVEGVNALNRGGVLRLGAVLTTTSAPLRTSPVKRGDWVLRRILGTPTPPPPPDAGSIPNDPKLFGGLSVRDRLAQHKRNATCATCHTRIDPMGFPLEHFDSTGRWRELYPDGKPIDDRGEMRDKSIIPGVQGLLTYLKTQEPQVQLTLSHKLIGYALGRTVQGSDQMLVDRMVAAGSKATMTDLATMVVTSAQFRNAAPNTPAAPAAAAKPPLNTAGIQPKNSDKVGTP